MYSRRIFKIILPLMALLIATLACSIPTRQSQPTAVSQNAVETKAAATLQAMLTQAVPQTGKTTPENPTATAQVVTLQPTSTTAAQPTATQKPPEPTAIPTATATPQPCDRAGFISDVSVPDGTAFPAGTTFTKTWRLKNMGTCTWTTDYALVFDSGDGMNAQSSQKLGSNVLPGQTIDVSISLKAPGSSGQYRGYWKLRNASGIIFGLGPENKAFFVDIKVVPSTTTGSGYDFTANYCLAEWITSAGKTLSCAEADGNVDGFILYKARPLLENGNTDDEPALLTNPPKSNDSVLRGKYPSYTVKNGDHFKAIIGCEGNAKNCNVRFQLDYQIDNGSIQNLGNWNESFEGNFTQVDVDLNNLAGKNVRFILTVLANGESNNDRAQWLLPRIATSNIHNTKPNATN